MAVSTAGGAAGGTSVTPDATANTKGAYAELTASSAIAAKGVLLCINMGGTSLVDYLFDLAIGAAASEVVIAANILAQGDGNFRNAQYIFLPIQIAASTRIAVRCQANGASGTAQFVGAYLLGSSTNKLEDMTTITNYGADTADSGGVEIDPGAVVSTKGSYVQITASSSNNIDWLSISVGNKGNGAMANASWSVDIATGGAGAETIVIADLTIRSNTAVDDISPSLLGPFPVTIPSGTRIAVRASCSSTDATDRLFDIVLHGAEGTTVAAGGAHFSASL